MQIRNVGSVTRKAHRQTETSSSPDLDSVVGAYKKLHAGNSQESLVRASEAVNRAVDTVLSGTFSELVAQFEARGMEKHAESTRKRQHAFKQSQKPISSYSLSGGSNSALESNSVRLQAVIQRLADETVNLAKVTKNTPDMSQTSLNLQAQGQAVVAQSQVVVALHQSFFQGNQGASVLKTASAFLKEMPARINNRLADESMAGSMSTLLRLTAITDELNAMKALLA